MADIRRASFIPMIYVAAMGVVVLVNAGMVAAALSSYSGLAYDDPFGRGVAYNAVLAEAERQEALGWRAVVSVGGGDDRSLSIAISDAQGGPLIGGTVTTSFVRPAEKMAPLRAELAETTPGQYAGHVALPARGQWDLRIAIFRSGERAELSQRIFVK